MQCKWDRPPTVWSRTAPRLRGEYTHSLRCLCQSWSFRNQTVFFTLSEDSWDWIFLSRIILMRRYFGIMYLEEGVFSHIGKSIETLRWGPAPDSTKTEKWAGPSWWWCLSPGTTPCLKRLNWKRWALGSVFFLNLSHFIEGNGWKGFISTMLPLRNLETCLLPRVRPFVHLSQSTILTCI